MNQDMLDHLAEVEQEAKGLRARVARLNKAMLDARELLETAADDDDWLAVAYAFKILDAESQPPI